MNLIPDWREAHTFLSVQIPSIGIAAGTAYLQFYDKLHEVIPAPLMVKITVAVFALSIIGRLKAQGEEKNG